MVTKFLYLTPGCPTKTLLGGVGWCSTLAGAPGRSKAETI